MSNQRVVVLTDDEIKLAWRAIHYYIQALPKDPLLAKLNAALEGITDDMIARAKDAYNYTLVSGDPWRAALEAALFPGDGEQ